MPEARLPIAASEGLFLGPVVIPPDKENPSGERCARAVGTTRGDREAFIVFTIRDRAGSVWIRPISARYMHRKEVALHEETYPSL